MSTGTPILETILEGLSTHRRGKVRDIYEVGAQLLIVATDRISAYDFVLGSAIPDKGKVLTQLSVFWFRRTADIVPNHLISVDPYVYPSVLRPHADVLAGRSMLVRRARPVLIECVARGYLSGSGWREYRQTGQVCGITLPVGLRESERLPEPIFTPATKASDGHDVNISQDEAANLIGRELVERLRALTLELYAHGSQHAESCGIIVADTKFEFGWVNGELTLIDEVLTPDSSRFWDVDEYVVGQSPPSFDKQIVRNHLIETEWDREPPIPTLPSKIVERTSARYRDIQERLAT